LININNNTDGIFLLVNYKEFYLTKYSFSICRENYSKKKIKIKPKNNYDKKIIKIKPKNNYGCRPVHLCRLKKIIDLILRVKLKIIIIVIIIIIIIIMIIINKF